MLFLIAMCISSLSNSQAQIKKSSIDSGGDSLNNGTLSMIYSIGEVAINEILNNNLSLSEGFIGKDLFLNETVMACTNLPSNLISWWTGDNNSQDLYGNNHGTPQGGTTYFGGVVNNAFLFDGVDDVVVVPDSNDLDLTGNMTVELWVRQTGFETDRQTVLCKGAGIVPSFESATFSMRFDWATTKFLFKDITGTIIELGGPAFEDWQWHHYAYVRQGNQHILYADGFGFGWFSFTNLPASSAGLPLTIGAQYKDSTSATNEYSNFFGGEVDEIGIYNRALSEAEIQSIFNAGADGKCSAGLSIKDDSFSENQIKIYPNPVTDVFTLGFTNSSKFNSGSMKLQIFDLLGKPVKTINNINIKEQINISTLNSGMYVYKLANTSMSLTGKIVKR